MATTAIILKVPVPVLKPFSDTTKRQFQPPSFRSPPRLKLVTPLYSHFRYRTQNRNFHVLSCLPHTSPPPLSKTPFNPSTKLFVSGLSFRTTEESLINAFKNFGQLLEVNLVMDNIAKRPKGFAFLRYATEEESKKAIEGMHGKFLDGRVIFVEVAKSRAELRQGPRQSPRN